LKRYFAAAKNSGIVKAVIVNGSYVTCKDEPDDVDLIAVLDSGFDWTQELRPYKANMIDRAAIRREYKFDGFAYNEDETGLKNQIAVFAVVTDKHVGLTSKTHKGMVRVRL
jgi:hypothetical protein